MFAFLGIIIGVLILVVLFLVAIEISLNNKINVIQARQGRLQKELYLSKKEYQEDMKRNNKDIAKELSKLDRNSTCFVGFSERIPVSLLIVRFIESLGYDITGREFKIIKKGDQGSGKVREKEKTVCKDEKAKKN